MRERTLDAAHGRWREILPMFGVPATILNGKHHPCPACGGKDRFRFHDRNGNGDYYCAGCGAGKGVKLISIVNGWNYGEAARKVDEYIGTCNRESYGNKPRPVEKKQIDTRAAAFELWKRSKPIESGDPAWLYLYSRGLKVQSTELRFIPELFHSDTETNYPGMIARICDVHGVGQTLHRTYLASDGGKANRQKLSQADGWRIPKVAVLSVSRRPQQVMGVAEGIETALSASVIGLMPVWSTVSEALLQTWQPPEEAKEIFIWADNDANYVGQNAAYALAKRLKLENDGLNIEVKIPNQVGTDWNDVLLREGVAA